MTDILQQLMTSVMRQALPSASAVRHVLASARGMLLWSIMSAMLMALLVAIALYGGYLLLLTQGVFPLTALLIIGVILALVTVISGLLAHRYMERIAAPFEEESPGPSVQPDQLMELVEAFVSGFSTPPPSAADMRAEMAETTAKEEEKTAKVRHPEPINPIH